MLKARLSFLRVPSPISCAFEQSWQRDEGLMVEFQALVNERNIFLCVWGWRGLPCAIEKAGCVCWPCICGGRRQRLGVPWRGWVLAFLAVADGLSPLMC